MKLVLKFSKVSPWPINPKCLILGDGRCLDQDLKAWGSMTRDPHDVMVVGRAYQRYQGPVRHWANVDAADAKWWADQLRRMVRHTIGEYPWMDVAWDVVENKLWNPEEVLWHGSSALFAVHVCLALGYESIVLAGCPLDSGGHWYDDTPGPRWTGESYQAWLDFARTPEARRVSSLSGYTRQILRGGMMS